MLPNDIALATRLATFLAMSNVSSTHDLWLTQMRYSQDNTSDMFINIPFVFAASKILQLCKYFESVVKN